MRCERNFTVPIKETTEVTPAPCPERLSAQRGISQCSWVDYMRRDWRMYIKSHCHGNRLKVVFSKCQYLYPRPLSLICLFTRKYILCYITHLKTALI